MASLTQVELFVIFFFPQPLEAFRNALAWEEEKKAGAIITQEKESVFIYESDSKMFKGILLEGAASEIPTTAIDDAFPSFKGFGLIIFNKEMVSCYTHVRIVRHINKPDLLGSYFNYLSVPVFIW